jgi:hypothetical protein
MLPTAGSFVMRPAWLLAAEVHAVNVDPRGECQFVIINALNEFDPKITRLTSY